MQKYFFAEAIAADAKMMEFFLLIPSENQISHNSTKYGSRIVAYRLQ